MSHFLADISAELDQIKSQSLWKTERPIISPQRPAIKIADGRNVVNFCANNYLGLADHPELIQAAHAALETHGLGMASVRFICGTSNLHQELEAAIAAYSNMEDAILYPACFDANGGVFEPLLKEEDAIISDSLNHASLIDGIRLCKAKRYRYANNNMEELETQLQVARSKGARRVLIATDGVFSMDGYLAQLKIIRQLADRYDALILVDDCHATGVVGPQGQGTAAGAGVDVDIITGTLGKALGGSAGGYVTAAKPIVALLRQRSRPYLFSNALPPALVAASLKAIALARSGDGLRAQLFSNARFFRQEMSAAGFQLLEGEHPIIPVMLGDAKLAQKMAALLYEEAIYVAGFFYPVVPEGKARIRVQLSAAHQRDNLDQAVAAFKKTGRQLGVI